LQQQATVENRALTHPYPLQPSGPPSLPRSIPPQGTEF
jgi:hypothetical protein